MTSERPELSPIDQLRKKAVTLRDKYVRASGVFSGLETPGFTTKPGLRLDVDDPEQKVGNIVRVGLMKERLEEVAIPSFLDQLERVAGQIETAEAEEAVFEARLERLAARRETVQRLVAKGILDPGQLTVVDGEIERVRVQQRQAIVPVQPVEPEKPVEVPGEQRPSGVAAGGQLSTRIGKRETFEIEIGGRIISGQGRMAGRLLEGVRDTSRAQPVDLAELITKIYGSGGLSFGDRTRSLISVANSRKLQPQGLQIVYDLSAGKVWLEEIESKEAPQELKGEVSKTEEVMPGIVKIEVLDMVVGGKSHVRLGNRIIELSERELAVLTVLGVCVGQEIISSELSRLAFSGSSAERSRLRDVVVSLKSKLNVSGGLEIIVSGGKSNQAWVMLQDAEVVFPPTPSEESAFPLEVSRVDALRLVLENSGVSLEQVKAVLDPEGKFTPERVIMSLRRTIAFLAERVKREITTIPEEELIESMPEITGKTDFLEAINEIARRLEQWIKLQGSREIVVIPEVPVLSQMILAEVSALSELIKEREGTTIGINGSSFVFRIEPEFQELFVRLRGRWVLPEDSVFVPIPKRELINSALVKLSQMVRLSMEDLNSYVEGHEGDIEEFLIWFYFQNTEKMQGLLADFLSSDVRRVWREGLGGLVEGFEMVWPERMARAPEHPPVPAGLSSGVEPVGSGVPGAIETTVELVDAVESDVAESVVPAEPEAEVESVAPLVVTVEPLRPSSRVQQLERRLPDVRNQVEKVVDQLAAQNSLEQITGARISQIFNNVTATVMNKMEEKRFITAQRVHSGVFEYSIEDVVVVVIMNENRNAGWDRRLVDTLKDLAREEVEKRLSELSQ